MKQGKMRILYYFFLLFTIIHTNSIGQTIETNQHDKSRHEKWIEDLKYFDTEFLGKSKTYLADSLIACKKRLADLELLIDSLNDNQIILELSRCVAMANNGHTTIHLNWMKKIPVRFFWFSDGLYVIKTDSLNSEYLGCKVLEINLVAVNEVQERLNPYLSGIDSWKKFTATNYLCSPQILNGIGISTDDSLTLTLLGNNDTLKVCFGNKQMKNSGYEYEAWAMLYPDIKQTEWKHVLKTDENLPLYLKNMKQGVFYEFLKSKNIAYFSINALWYKCPNFKEKIIEFIDSLEMVNDCNVIIDLRYYTGGNYFIPLKLATKPPKILDDDKKIFLITSNMTFSAGLNTAARVKYFAKDKIVIVGENVGDNLKFRAEGIYYKLPNSKLKIQDAKYEHDWENDKFIPFKTYYFNLFLGVPAKSLMVDKEIKLSFEDYLNYKDPIMDWILEQ
jgi:hypothetical protein